MRAKLFFYPKTIPLQLLLDISFIVFKSYIGFKNQNILCKIFHLKKIHSRFWESVCAIVKDVPQIAINSEINTEYIFILCLHMGRVFFRLSFLDL